MAVLCSHSSMQCIIFMPTIFRGDNVILVSESKGRQELDSGFDMKFALLMGEVPSFRVSGVQEIFAVRISDFVSFGVSTRDV